MEEQINQSVVHRWVEWRSRAVAHLSREYQEKIGEHLPSLRCHSTMQGPPKRGAIPGLKSVRPCTCLEACCSTWPLWVAVWINANSVLVNEPEEVTAVAQVFCHCRLAYASLVVVVALCCPPVVVIVVVNVDWPKLPYTMIINGISITSHLHRSNGQLKRERPMQQLQSSTKSIEWPKPSR